MNLIQVFNNYLQPGGEEKSVARIARSLERAGHTVHRFWRSSNEWRQAGAPPRWKQPFLLWRNPAMLDELRRLHEQTRPDVWLIHNVVPVISLGAYGLARELGAPVLQWLHNYRPISPSGTLMARGRCLRPEDPRVPWKETLAGSWNGRLATAMLALGIRRLRRRGDWDHVSAWVAISEEMRSVFARAGWYPPRLHALRHSWEIHPAPPARRDEGYFLFLGRLVESKGVRFLVRLWADPALARIPLVIAGQGPLREELMGASPPNIRWAGHVEGAAKQELLAGCRAVLFPSLWPEPLGLAAYEAFEMAKPVLASDLGGLREVVHDGRTGRLLEPGNAAGWREAVLGLDAAQSEQLGQAGRRWLEANTSAEAWNRGFEAIVSKISR